MAEAETAAREQERAGGQMAELTTRLEGEAYASGERAELARIQARLAEIGYDTPMRGLQYHWLSESCGSLIHPGRPLY